MTTTIGPFTNVPTPGDPVKSDWAQQITTYVSDRKVYSATGAGGTVASGSAVDVVTLTTPVVPAGRQLLVTYSAWVKQTTASSFDVLFTATGLTSVSNGVSGGNATSAGAMFAFTRKVIATAAQTYTFTIRINAWGAQAVQWQSECNIAALLI